MAKLGHLALVIGVLLLASIVSQPLIGSLIPVIPRANAAGVSIRLNGFAVGGWNASTNPNPTITVYQSDTVSLNLVSSDGAPHLFLLDVDKDGVADTADCPATDPCSSQFTTSTMISFSASGIAPGTYTYYCTIHSTSMRGNFVVLAPDFSITASPSSLIIPAGSFKTSQITLTSGGFSGTISLSSTVAPNDPTVTTTLKPPAVTLTSGGTGISVLNVTTTTFTPLGTYTVTVTGTSGSLSHSTAVALTVSSGTVGGTGTANQPALPLAFIGITAVALTTLVLAGIYTRRSKKTAAAVSQA